MSQQFQADAQASVTVITLTNGSTITLIATNPLVPPFGNFKSKVHASVDFTLGSIPTAVRLQIVRNPAAENLIVADTGAVTLGVAANLLGHLVVDGTDQVPDGRPCIYQAQAIFTGTGTNGSTSRQYVEAGMLSG